jgi:hypothetical protein
MDWQRFYYFLEVQNKMAHFAKLDDNNMVLEVHVVHNNEMIDPTTGQETEAQGIKFLTEWSGGHTNWRQTSYNGSIRRRYAGKGFRYDPQADIFIEPPTWASWIWNTTTLEYDPPIPMPSDAGTGNPPKTYKWDESIVNWSLESAPAKAVPVVTV